VCLPYENWPLRFVWRRRTCFTATSHWPSSVSFGQDSDVITCGSFSWSDGVCMDTNFSHEVSDAQNVVLLLLHFRGTLQTIEPQPQSRSWHHELLHLATTTVTRLLTSVRGCMTTVNNLNPRSRASPVFGPRPWTTQTSVPTNHIAPNPTTRMKTLRAGSLS
jgi:hypothetical protein